MLPTNLGYLFDAPLRLQPAAPAVLQGDVILSFEQLDDRCNRIANALRELGVQPGDRVALMFKNDYRFIECLLAPMRIGAVPVPVNIRMGDDPVAFVVADSDAKVLIAGPDMASRARQIADRIPAVRHLIAVGTPFDRCLEYEPLVSSSSPTLPRMEIDPGQVCLQPYTSGSTGKPKGVLLTHRGQIWNADVCRKTYMLDHTDCGLVAVPLFHKNAMSAAVKPLLLAGGSFAILPAFDAAEVISAISRFKITYITGVPAMYKMILAQTGALQKHDVSSLRFAICGSAEVPDSLLKEFQRVFGVAIAEGYGLTEGGPVPLANVRCSLKKRGSCGRLVPGSEVKIVAEDGVTELGPGQVGELVVRNPGLAKGYWKLPEATAQKFRDGWLYTGDLMRFDEDGYYYFVGRKDDMINVAGENVYPKEVEDVLLRHPSVKEAAVVPAQHPVKGYVPVAFIVEKRRGELTEEEIKKFYLEQGAPYAHPRRVYFYETLPLAGTGKIDRTLLKRAAAAEPFVV
jgi:acyl-CoA synthetase (AMP-forming)/AMP-acid ligase II